MIYEDTASPSSNNAFKEPEVANLASKLIKVASSPLRSWKNIATSVLNNVAYQSKESERRESPIAKIVSIAINPVSSGSNLLAATLETAIGDGLQEFSFVGVNEYGVGLEGRRISLRGVMGSTSVG